MINTGNASRIPSGTQSEEHLDHGPWLFLLSGLGGEQRLFRGVPQVVPVQYMLWPEFFEQGNDYDVQFREVKAQIVAHRKGPVRMVGYSVGGMLAWACASSFQASGLPVESVIILDAHAYPDRAVPPPRAARLMKRFDELLSFNVRAAMASLTAKFLSKNSSASLLRRALPYRNSALPFDFHSFLNHKLNMQLQLPTILPWWNQITETMPKLNAPVFLFRSEEHEPSERQDLGWGELCSDVTVVPVAGSHNGMLEPENCQALSESILRVLQSAGTLTRS